MRAYHVSRKEFAYPPLMHDVLACVLARGRYINRMWQRVRACVSTFLSRLIFFPLLFGLILILTLILLELGFTIEMSDLLELLI